MSGLPRGNGFGAIFFTLFINDLTRDTLANFFADDTNLLQVLFSAVCHQEQQSDIEHVVELSDKWKLRFNISKCKVMHIQCNRIQYWT